MRAVISSSTSWSTLSALLTLAASCWAGEYRNPDAYAAIGHRSKYPVVDQPNQYYIGYSHIPKEKRAAIRNVCNFVIASTSSQQLVSRCVPSRVTDTLDHIDIHDLKWDRAAWVKILKARNPYGGHNLILRPEWLIIELTDANESDTHYQLLYGGVVPKTRDEFLKFWRVDTSAEDAFGQIEGKSGVSVAGQRWLVSHTRPRGYAWGTRDVFRLEKGKDPLEAPDGSFRHDGEEWIIGIPKIGLDGTRGALQVYFLSDGKGNRVDKADGDLVRDHSGYRGLLQIRTAGSCIQCHAEGINPPSENKLRTLLQKGVRLQVTAKTKDPGKIDKLGKGAKDAAAALELFHLSDAGTEVKRNNEQFAAGLLAVNGLEPSENISQFKAAIAYYDSAVTLEQAAAELYTDVDTLKKAVGLAEKVGARVALLIEGDPMPRSTFEQKYTVLAQYLHDWEVDGGNVKEFPAVHELKEKPAVAKPVVKKPVSQPARRNHAPTRKATPSPKRGPVHKFSRPSSGGRRSGLLGRLRQLRGG